MISSLLFSSSFLFPGLITSRCQRFQLFIFLYVISVDLYFHEMLTSLINLVWCRMKVKLNMNTWSTSKSNTQLFPLWICVLAGGWETDRDG